MPLDQIDIDKYEYDPSTGSYTPKKEMNLLEHLEELRWHIIRALIAVTVIAVVVFFARDFVFDRILLAPQDDDFASYRFFCWLSAKLGTGEALCLTPPPFEIITVQLGEAFLMHIKATFVLAFVVASPYVFWEIWRFVSPGLASREQRFARYAVGICSSLFFIGVLFGYFVISPFAVTFLANYGFAMEGVIAKVSLTSFVNYMIMFSVPAGIVFELPIVVWVLAKLGLLTPEFMRQYRRHAIILILMVAAIITPPDVVTQILIGMPLYVLYEISISICARVVKQREAEMLA